ncbi:hypothetical protein GOODEAATRI_002881 [Goodea atripinnis]|uniref:Uncharacterized protein n=1 Tax=Goodea atripinnis TaxID=208336 RepID=A0ABV0PKB5_9TELE
MATSTGLSEATVQRMSKQLPVLPPIEKLRGALERSINAQNEMKEEMKKRTAAHKKLLRHRTEMQQKYFHMTMVSRAMEYHRKTKEMEATRNRSPEPHITPTVCI